MSQDTIGMLVCLGMTVVGILCFVVLDRLFAFGHFIEYTPKYTKYIKLFEIFIGPTILILVGLGGGLLIIQPFGWLVIFLGLFAVAYS